MEAQKKCLAAAFRCRPRNASGQQVPQTGAVNVKCVGVTPAPVTRACPGPAWPDQRIADAFSCHVGTVENVRRRLVWDGLAAALERKKQAQPSHPPKLDRKGEARMSTAPDEESRISWEAPVMQAGRTVLSLTGPRRAQTPRSGAGLVRPPRSGRPECWFPGPVVSETCGTRDSQGSRRR